MAGNPALPNPKNPAGQVSRIRKAAAAVGRNLLAVKRWLFEEIDSFQVTTVTVSAVAGSDIIGNESSYQYQVDLATLQRITREIALRLGLHDKSVIDQVLAAYEDGTGQTITNLSLITDQYTRTVTQVLNSVPYFKRTAIIGARVFEEMQGFNGKAGADLARVLYEGVLNGQNPRALKKALANQFEIEAHRAERIARTEITGALRRARWDEAQDARENLGIRTGLLWLSALSPTTRATHAARHGHVYTNQDVRDFYSVDGNGINCKCSQVEILLNDDGSPRNTKFVERVLLRK
jgi:SPP1 gp7 family putative phage head morphogenesis protein